MTPDASPELLKYAFRIDEAIKATGLGRSFLYERMAAGELKSVKICGRRLILREDLMAFLHQTKAGPICAALPVMKPTDRKTHRGKDQRKPRGTSAATSAQMELPFK